MNKKLIVSIGAMLCIAVNSQAQTNSGFGGLLKQIAKDGYNELKSVSFKDGVTVTPFALYHSGDYGAGIAVRTASTNLFNVGFFVAAVDETHAENKKKSWTFYDGGVSLSATKGFTVPVVNWTVDGYLETGLATDLSDPKTVYSQSIGGFKKSFKLSNKWVASLGGGVGYLSRWTEPFYIGHVSISRAL